MKSAVYTQEFTVRSYEVDPGGNATVASICNYLQEAAGGHALKLNYDITQLQEKSLTWVLYRLYLRMHTYPSRWERIKVETWPSGGEGLRAFRDFLLKDKDGTILGKALTEWMILNLKTHRPIRIPDEVLKMAAENRDHVMSPASVDLAEPAAENEGWTNTDFPVLRGDLDMNGHVNNVRYIEWMLESVPWEVYKEGELGELQIVFKSEGNLGDRIRSASITVESGESLQFKHEILQVNKEKPLALGKSLWKKD